MSDLMKRLLKHDGHIKNFVQKDTILQTSSPGINYLFGKKAGLKAGHSMLLYGPPKSGKSLVSLAFAGRLHQLDPEAIVLKFDTEFRPESQEHWAKAFGIDPTRMQYYMTNKPEEIFDFIGKDVQAMVQDEMKLRKTDDPEVGNPIKLIIIDSLAGIKYPKEANAELTTDNQMGDAAAYLPKGFKEILPVLRKYNIGLIACQHIRDNMNANTQKFIQYNVPGGKGIKHFIENWMLVEKVNGKDSKTFDSDKLDGSGRPIQTGHTIRVKMEEASNGPQNRAVEIDLSYTDGLINPHKEIATLAVNMGIIETAGAWVKYNDKKWQGVENFAVALKEDIDLQASLVKKIQENDIS
jgi:RecA/RadA recombinase